MTSFLFQFQFSQKISHFSIAKFTKILRQHTCFFVPKKCLILGPVLSFLDQIFVMWRCSMPFFIHYMLTFLICLDAAYLLNFCKVCQLVFILSEFVFCFLSWTKPMVFILSGLFLFSFSYLSVVILSEFVCCSWTYAKFATVFILSGIGFAKKCSLKVCATVFILLGFVVAIQVRYTVVVWYLWSQ